MSNRLSKFLTDESGAVTLDWVVLSAALVGTGLSVLATVNSGVGFVSVGTADQLRGTVVRSSFGSEACSGGIAALQAKEQSRVNSYGGQRINIEGWIETQYGGVGEDVLQEEYEALSARLDGTNGWSRDHTIMTALECELEARRLARLD